jgi:hypothetical protein
MNDRELLEFAAKAAGLEGFRYCDHWRGMAEWYESDGGYFGGKTWNPLANDGDALRLAVGLDIEFYQGDDDGPAAYAGYWWKANRKDVALMFCIERIDNDKFASARRAIVRAAAEIWKSMEDKRK